MLAAACEEPSFDRPERAWAALGSPDARTREAAAQAVAMSRTGPPSAEDARDLARAAADEAPWVRRWAVAALGRCAVPPDVAVPALARALSDETACIREAALDSLASYGRDGAAAIPALVALASSGDERLALSAAWVLGGMGKPARVAAPALERLGFARALARIDLSLPVVEGAERTGLRREEIVSIRVDVHGRLEVRGRRLDREGLLRYLASRADTDRRVDGTGLSEIRARLVLDEDLPWSVAQALLAACEDPTVGIDRIEFLVRRAEDRATGRVETWQPWDRLRLVRTDGVYRAPVDARIVLSKEGPPYDPEESRSRLADLARELEHPVLGLLVDRDLPVREVLRVVALAHEAGAAGVLFLDAPDPERLATPLETLAARPAPPDGLRPSMALFVERSR